MGSDAPTADQGSHPQPCSFGRYRVLRPLGLGSFGEVFLARDEELKRLVAVKVQRLGRVSSTFDADEFLREARLLAHLDHPGIVAVYDVGRTEDGRCYIVSKYIEGMTVLEMLGKHRPSFEEAAHIVTSVAEALQYAHDAGVVHRDLKPSNILISTEGEVFLTDFGIALSATDVDLDASIIGTPAYMSPEQARGESHWVDGRSDTFSLGTVFYELLVGELPFGEVGDKHQVLNRILNDQPKPLRQLNARIPVAFERICLKALAKAPNARYAATREMADELRRALDSRRRRWPRAVATLLGLAIAIIVLGWAIPASVGRLREATELRLARRILDAGGTLRIAADRDRLIRAGDQLPAAFQISYINLGGNRQLRDEDLRMIRGIRRLNALDLNTTPITDRGLEFIGHPPELTQLWLNYTNITAAGPKHLRGLNSLEHLDVNYTSVDDESLKEIGTLARLRFLGLSHTQVTDAGMAYVRGLDALTILKLDGTKITDAGLVHLKNLKKLKRLFLKKTNVTEDGLAMLRRELPRCEIKR